MRRGGSESTLIRSRQSLVRSRASTPSYETLSIEEACQCPAPLSMEIIRCWRATAEKKQVSQMATATGPSLLGLCRGHGYQSKAVSSTLSSPPSSPDHPGRSLDSKANTFPLQTGNDFVLQVHCPRLCPNCNKEPLPTFTTES